MNIDLTKDAEKLIVIIYKQYLSRRKQGVSKFNAVDFEIEEVLCLDKVTNWTEDDIEDTLSELHEQDLIEMDLANNFSLTTKGIVYLENRFKNNLVEVSDFIAKFIP